MAPVLDVRHLRKSFGGVPVLRDVSFAVATGEVVALAGENGAGKSTIMKIASGQIDADGGRVIVAGVEHESLDPRTARAAGIGIVPQELAPYPDLTVYENLFVGRELRTRLGGLDRRRMIREATTMLEVFEVDIDPRARMRQLSVALTQLVEIAKATTWGAKMLLLDEPTSAIPDREVEQLFAVVRRLQAQGVGMVYTTHRMAEIEALADRVVVMRDGFLVTDAPKAEVSEDQIVHAMIGRELESLFPPVGEPSGEVGLSVRGLRLERGGPSVSFDVRRGEIVGLGGLVGAGRTEIVEAVLGLRRSVEGTVAVGGERIRRNHPADAIRRGVAIVPEDRKGAGLVLTQPVLDNGSLPHLSAFSTAGWLRNRARRAGVTAATERTRVRCRGLDQPVSTLSGGNQQKVVVARWLTQDMSVLLLDEPTRGVDVGARGEIYQIIHDLAASGLAVVLVSSDMPELIGLSNRVLVLRAGEVVGELSREQLDADDAQTRIFRFASGLDRAAHRTADEERVA